MMGKVYDLIWFCMLWHLFQVVGTQGYAAPDYIKTGHLTTKSDVWSFGVVLYEILTGRRCLDPSRPRSERKLLDWVKEFPVESSRFTMIIDPRLKNRYSSSAAQYVAKLANSCLSANPKGRPTMSQVVQCLKRATGWLKQQQIKIFGKYSDGRASSLFCIPW